MRFPFDCGPPVSYPEVMEEKTALYASLLRKAELCNRDNKGKPTKAEANYYFEAAKVCEDVMGLNISNRAVYTPWSYRKTYCEKYFKGITKALASSSPDIDSV